MTLRDVVQAVLRRWYIVVVLVGIGVAGAFALHSDGGSYATRTSIVFTLPGQAALLPGSGATDDRVIAFAANVAQEINGGRPAESYATADAPAYGAGVREGVWVGLPNHGGQWVDSFGLAQIEIQIVARTEAAVYDKQQELLLRVEQLAVGQQREAGVSDAELITTSVVPLTARIDHVTPSRSATVIAFGAIGAAAAIVGVWLAVLLDRRIPRFRGAGPLLLGQNRRRLGRAAR